MVRRINIPYIILVVFMVIPAKADLTRAYSFFLIENYDSALYYYEKSIEADSSNVEAWAGMMNCRLYQKEYEEAIYAGNRGLSITESFLLHHKMAYLYALKDNDERVSYHYEKALSIPENKRETSSEDHVRSMILSIGYGYMYGGNRNTALRWFARGKEKYGDDSDFIDAINRANASKSIKTSYLFANAHAGIINYAESNYYDKGIFFSVNPSLTFKRRHFLSIGYSQSDIELKKNVPYSYVRKMYTDNADIPKGEMDFVFEDIFPVGGGNFDTVYYADVPVDPKTYNDSLTLRESTYNPEDLWIKEISVLYKFLNIPVKNTSLLAGYRYSISNMRYSEKTYTAYVGHFTSLNNFSLGGLYHFTGLDSVNLIQISPNISTMNKKLNLALQMHGVIRLTDMDSTVQWFPPFQLSLDATLSYQGRIGSVSLTTQTGQRAFTLESYGTFFRNSYGL